MNSDDHHFGVDANYVRAFTKAEAEYQNRIDKINTNQ